MTRQRTTDRVVSQAYVLDFTAPMPAMTSTVLPSSSSFNVRSSEVGTAYLVNISVDLNAQGSALASVLAAPDSLWSSVAISSADTDTALALSGLSDGVYKLYTQDVAGNWSQASSNAMTLDSAAPPAVISVALSADTGPNGATGTAQNSDLITATAAQNLTGQLSDNLRSGQSVSISLDGGQSWQSATATVGSSAWSLAGVTLSGSNTIKAKVVGAGGIDGSVYSRAYVLDNAAPSTTISGVALSADTAAFGATATAQNSDFITRTSAQTVSGTLSDNHAADEAVYDSLNNGSTWTAASANVGANTWSLVTSLSASNMLKVKVSDAAGNDGAVLSQVYVIDQSAPDAPSLSLGTGVAGGATSAEARAASGVLSLNAEAGASVILTFTHSVNSSKTLSKTIAATGTAQAVVLSSADLLVLGNGSINVRAVVSDAAGNLSEASTSSFVLDTSAPLAPTLALGQGVADGATGDEATAASGAVTVNAENGSSTVVTFTNGSHVVSKTVAGTGAARAVVLDPTDLGTLGDGAIQVSAVSTDAAGNVSGAGTVNFELHTEAAQVSSGPVISSATGLQNSPLNAGDVLTVSVTFSEAVRFSDSGVGLNFKIGNTIVTATSVAANTNLGTVKTFSYTVLTGDNDTGGISIAANPLVITGATTTITDAANNNAVLGYSNTTADSTNHLVDTTPPTVAISADKLALNAETGSTSSTVTFSFSEDPVGFDLSDVVVKQNATTLTAGTDYTWGSLSARLGTGTLADPYRYTATFTPKSGYSDNMVLSIASSTFQDAAGNFNADGSDGNNSLQLAVDTVRPTVSMSTSSSSDVATAIAKQGDTVTLYLSFSEAVTGLTTSDIVVPASQGTVSNLVQIDSAHYSVDFKPASNLATNTAITLSINSNAVTDLQGNANTDGGDANNSVRVTVDTQPPEVRAVTMRGTDAAGTTSKTTLIDGDKLWVEVTFSESVTVSGTPEYNINVGGTTRTATYDAQASSGNTRVFSYVVSAVNGDNDNAGGITARANVLSLGSDGVITDRVGNNAIISVSATPVTGSNTGNGPDINTIKVDTITPTVSLTRSGSHVIAQDNITSSLNSTTLTFTFSEDPGDSFSLGDVGVTVANSSNPITTLVAGTHFNWGVLSPKLGSGTPSDPYKYTATFTPVSTVALRGRCLVPSGRWSILRLGR